jgi:hypothetical protein
MNDTVSTGSTDPRLASYLDVVAAALAGAPGLSEGDRRELLDDLAAHLAEVAAEDETDTLEERLGPPDAYARELLASAGVEVPGPGATRRPTVADARRRLSELSRHPWAGPVRAAGPDLTVVGWALRGYLLALVVAAVTDGLEAPGFPVPRAFGSEVLGLPLTAALVVWSLRAGRRAQAGPPPPRWRQRVLWLGTAIGGLVALGLITTPASGPANILPVSSLCPLQASGEPILNVHAFTLDGRPLDQVLLYDQDGRPVGIPSGCTGNDPPLDQRGRPVDNLFPQPTRRWDAPRVPAAPPTAPAVSIPRVPGAPGTTAAPTTTVPTTTGPTTTGPPTTGG